MEKPSPSWHLMKALLEATLEAGIEVHAIQRHYSDFSGNPFPDSIINNRYFSYSIVNTGKQVNKSNFVKRYLSGIEYSLKSRKCYKHNLDFDLVFVQSAPTALFYLTEARRFSKKKPVVYNSQDMFPGSAIANGSIKNGLLAKIFFVLQRIAYKQATVITAISEDMRQKLIEQGVPRDKIEVIVNWYDDSAVKEVAWEKNRFVKKYNLDHDKFYVQYAGTMGTNFNPRIILDVAELLQEYPCIEFQMIGNGVRKESFEKEAKEKGLGNIVFYPLQPQELVPDVYSACSVCLIPLQRGVIGNSVPSKAGLLMACRRVIINSVDISSDYAKMFEREKIGFSSDITDSSKIANDILYLYNNPQVRKEYEDRARIFGEKEYSSTVNTKKYIELFKRLAGK